jgi:hypothetical protein
LFGPADPAKDLGGDGFMNAEEKNGRPGSKVRDYQQIRKMAFEQALPERKACFSFWLASLGRSESIRRC